MIAVALGALLVFVAFPRKDDESRLLAEYRAHDEPAEAGISGGYLVWAGSDPALAIRGPRRLMASPTATLEAVNDRSQEPSAAGTRSVPLVAAHAS